MNIWMLCGTISLLWIINHLRGRNGVRMATSEDMYMSFVVLGLGPITLIALMLNWLDIKFGK